MFPRWSSTGRRRLVGVFGTGRRRSDYCTIAVATVHNNRQFERQPSRNIAPNPLLIRSFARSSESGVETPRDKAVTFLLTVGYERDIANGVADALEEAGMQGDAILGMVRQLAGRWEVGEDEGLEALVASVKQELLKKQNKQKVHFTVYPPTAWKSSEEEEDVPSHLHHPESAKKYAFTVDAFEGTTLTDVAKFGEGDGAATLGEYLECACSGIMACSTCHVVVDKNWYTTVGEPCEDEQDMLDLAYGPKATSRLGCQVTLTKELDGMVIWLPKGANNIMDHIPFEDDR